MSFFRQMETILQCSICDEYNINLNKRNINTKIYIIFLKYINILSYVDSQDPRG